MSATVKYPSIKVQLTGEDGNALAVLHRCTIAARDAGLSEAEIVAFRDEATAGDYDHLLRTCRAWFDCS